MNAAETVKAIQSEYFVKYFTGTELAQGLPEGGFEKLVEVMRRYQRPEAAYFHEDSDTLNRLLQLKEAGSYSNFQIPLDLLKLHRYWNFFQRSDRHPFLPKVGADHLMDDGDESDIDLNAILLASAPMGDLNARAIIGSDGSHAILFESSLNKWFLSLSKFVTRLFFTNENGYYQLKFLPEEIDWQAQAPVLTKLAQFFIDTATSGFPAFELSEGLDIDELYMFTGFFESGMTTFAMAHEYIHCARKHHRRLSASRLNAGNKVSYFPHDLKKFWEIYQSTYSKRYPGITPMNFHQRFHKQALEKEADIYGHMLSVNAFHHYPDVEVYQDTPAGGMAGGMGLMALNIGMFLHPWSMEILERTFRTLSNGDSGMNDPLLTRDFGIQNMILRTAHPCPMSRIQNLKSLPQGDIINRIVEPIFEAVWNICSRKALELWSEGVRPHPRWVNESTEMGQHLRLAHSG